MKHETIVLVLETLMSESSKNFSEKEKALKIRTWMTKLKEIPDVEGLRALYKCLDAENKFMPSVGKFKQMCLSGEGCYNLEDKAHGAWAAVIRHLNAYSSPVFKDTAIAETIRGMGGWKKLCSMLETEQPFRKKDFIDLYLVYSRQEKEFDPCLKGIYGDDFKFIGYEKTDDLVKVMAAIEQKETSSKKLLGMLVSKTKQLKSP